MCLCGYRSCVVFVYSGCVCGSILTCSVRDSFFSVEYIHCFLYCIVCVLCKFGVWFVSPYCLDVFFKACLKISAYLAYVF
jgi:hypothetical protein